MAYKKHKRGVPRRPKRRNGFFGRAVRYAKRAVGGGAVAYNAMRLALRLKDMVNTEYKYVDITDTASATYSGYFATLNNIAQGVTDSTRIGDSCKLQNLTLRGSITRNGTDGHVRIMVIWDKQAKASAASSILENTGSAYATLSPKKYDNRFQTKVLKDFRVHVTTDSPIKEFNMVIPINQHTQYDAATNTIDTGALRLLIISDMASSQPLTAYYSRLTYTDN